MSIQHFLKFHEHESWPQHVHFAAPGVRADDAVVGLRARYYPEFHGLRNGSQLLAIDRLHFDKTVVRHGF